MATVNFMVVCNHCGSIIRLRIGIGYSLRQPFAFSCKKCGTRIKGLLIAPSRDKLKLELNNASEANKSELTEANYLVECHEDFLLTNEPVEGFKLTPFMNALRLMEPNAELFIRDRSLFYHNQNELKEKLFRINNFYSHDRISELKKESNNLFNTDSKIECFKSLAQLNELYLIPIIEREVYRSNCVLYKNKILNLLRNNKCELLKLIDYLNKNNFFDNQFKENLKLLEGFDDLFMVIKPIITLKYIDKKNIDNLMFSIVDFDKTRQFYGDVFECIGRELNMLIGLKNIELNGNYEILNHPRFSKKKSFNDCINSSNGNKKQFLDDSADYYKLVEDVFDNKIRNGIGHHKCNLNEEKMEIEYYPYVDDIKKAKKETITYTSFILKAYNIFNLLLFFMYLKVILYSIYFANKGERTAGVKEINFIIEDNIPKVLVTYYWNEGNYNRPRILNYDFTYWDLNKIFNEFDLGGERAAKIHYDEYRVYFSMKGLKTVFKVRKSEMGEWLSSLLDRDRFEVKEKMFKPDLPFFILEPMLDLSLNYVNSKF